jgi:hypothetical protein
MPITLTFKKKLEKNILFKNEKNHSESDACVVNVLDVSILSKNCKFMLQGEK